mgnify:CR=1 FL=1
MSPSFEIQLIAIIVAAACALPGVFLVLRKMSMMSDAITHTILLGIVLAFFITKDLSSPLLIIGAAFMGVITVWLTETLNQTRLLSEDSAIGIVFPFLFSVAIILITRYAGSVHLDTDSVLLGELAFAPFDRFIIGGKDIGAKAIYSTGTLLLINLVFIGLFLKELEIVTFDPVAAATLGFTPAVVHYGLMTLVSLTTVGAFQAVGSVLVVAFMIGPPATAYLLTNKLKKMLLFSGLIGAINGILGYQLAAWLDVSIAGSMAVVTGIIFLIVFIFAPERGLITVLSRRANQKIDFSMKAFLFHIANHEGSLKEAEEAGTGTVLMHMNWDEKFTADIIERLKKAGYIQINQGIIKLTPLGREKSIYDYEEIFQ